MVLDISEKTELDYVDKAFLYGIFLMVFGSIIITFETITNSNFAIFRYIIMSLSTYYILKFIYYSKKTFNIINILFIIWSIFMILKSFDVVLAGENNFLLVKKILSGELLLFLFPLLGMCDINIFLLKKLFLVSFYLTLLGLFIVPYSSVIYQNFRVGENSFYGYENLSRIFTASGSILLLTFTYHRKRINYIVFFSIIIALLAFMVTARRNMIVYFGSVLFCGFIVLCISKENKKNRFFLIVVFLYLIYFSFFLFFLNIELFSLTISRFQTGFDSRDLIIDEFVLDFNRTPIDWFTGRGIFGNFSTTTLMTNVDLGLRDGIENGYLTHILRGGYIYLVLIIIIALKSIYTGLILSKNTLCKGFSFIIVIYLLDMVGFGIPENHFKFLMIWVGIAVINNNSILNLENNELIKRIGL